MNSGFVQTASILQRLKISSVVIALLVPLICLGVYFGSQIHFQRMSDIYRRNQLNITTLQIFRIIEVQAELIDRITIEGAHPIRKEALENTIKTETELVEKLINQSVDETVIGELKRFKRGLHELKVIIDRMVVADAALLESKVLLVKQLHIEAKEILTRIQFRWQEKTTDAFEILYRDRFFPLQVAIVLTMISMPLALFLGLSLTGRLRRSVQNFLQATQEVTDGNLSYRAPILHADEIGRITHSFNRMAESLQTTTVSRDYVVKIIDSMYDAVIVANHEGVIQRVNEVTSILLERRDSELRGKRLNSIFEGLAPAPGEVIKDQERTLIREDAEERSVLISISWLSRGDGGSDMICIVKDITQRKRSEDQLKAAHSALTIANADLEAFSYSVSHDLRAPLRSIDGFSQAIEEDYGDRLEGEAKDYFKRIRAATQRMSELIDALLGLAKIVRGELKREEVELGKMARQIGEELMALNPERKVELKVDERVVVHADPKLLRIVMENLLSNAFKFTSSIPNARIEFGSTVIDGKQTCFVKDNGAGFDMAYSDKLFGVFQRLHDQHQFAGTGIGLATVRRILLRHDGEIRAEAAVGKGATFYFRV